MEACLAKYVDFKPAEPDMFYCKAVFDSYLCWPPTYGGTTTTQKCPAVPFSDNSKTVTKLCNPSGYWEGKEPNGTQTEIGWTNYTSCFSREIQRLLTKLTGDSGTLKLEIAGKTRKLEICGLSISLISLILSLMIFCYFRSLRNNRTRIHKNLFVAMVIQVIIRLIVYIDQAIWRGSSDSDDDDAVKGIDNTLYLCEASYVLMEFGKTAMFMWMFIEGLYLHNIVTVTVFQETQYFGLYNAMGWGFPVVLTIAWVVANALYFQGQGAICWWGYNLNYSYWILEGPRLCVMVVNFIFLLNIIRVLVMKLRQSHTSEIEQVRKAVRAAVVLLPLLGITNLMTITTPLEKSVLEFAIWSYSTHFLSSFQGFFVALLYCFLNGEVRAALKKQFNHFLDLRQQRAQHRTSSAFHFITNEANNVHESDQAIRQTRHWWIGARAERHVEIPNDETSAPE